MQFRWSDRRWGSVLASMLVLTFRAITSSATADPLRNIASGDHATLRSQAAAARDPLIVSLPFEKATGGELQPNADAWAALLDKARQNPEGLLVIRPTGDLAGFGRADQVAPESSAAVAATDLSSPVSRLDACSTALLRAITALRTASPATAVSVLGLPLERNRFADQAAAGNGPYGQLIQQLDAFVSTRGLLHGSAALDDQAWMNQAMPSAVRLADGRPICFRTPAGWQQRSIPVKSIEDGSEDASSNPTEGGRVPHTGWHELGDPATSGSELPLDEADSPMRVESRVDGSRSSNVASHDVDVEAAIGMHRSDQAVPAGGFGGAPTDHADPITDLRPSDFAGGLLHGGSIAEPDSINNQTLSNELPAHSADGGAAVSPAPRSHATLPGAFRVFTPLAIGGDLVALRDVASRVPRQSASSGANSTATVSSRDSGNGFSSRTGVDRNASSAAATSPGKSSASSGGNGVAGPARATTASGGSGPSGSPIEATPPSAPRKTQPTPVPSPSAVPIGGSTTPPSSSIPAAPPPLNPVIPITPPKPSRESAASPASATLTPSPSPSRDWSTLPVNAGNVDSHIGGHAPGTSCFGSGIAFANLIYASVADPFELVRGLNGQGLPFGSQRLHNWSGDQYYTADGWPFKSDNGPISRTNFVQTPLVWSGRERMWSALGLTGSFEEPPVATQVFKDDGTPVNDATYKAPVGIAGRSFTFDVTCYWEGQGIAVAGDGRVPETPTVTSVEFTGPDGEGPFGDGPRTMSRSTTSYGAGSDRIVSYIIASDATGANPLRNLIVLVSNVRDASTGQLVYAGFDHSTYKPFQLYPQFVESMRHFKHMRSLHNDWAHFEPNGNRFIFESTGVSLQKDDGTTAMPIVTTGWTRPQPTAPGFEKGFAALNRPTNVGFGKSLRALIEVCNQLNADLWWCHPVPTVAVGTRNQDGTITYASQPGQDASNPNQVGRLLVDQAYVTGFADEIAAHLKPGLKVYSEWANEVWNWSAYYWHASAYAYYLAPRTIAPVEYGGDGGIWCANRTLGSPGIYAGVVLGADGNHAMPAFSAAASAMLAEAIRDRLGSDSAREIVCVAAGQSNWSGRSEWGLGQFWAAMPKLFKQLDAVAHAPYRSWWNNSSEADAQLVGEGAKGIWQSNDTVRGMLHPYATLPSLDLRSDSWWASAAYSSFLTWKHIALDHPKAGAYQRRHTPPNWPADKRRWDLDLLTYEGGNHHIPASAGAKLQSYPGTVHPFYNTFTLRYMETIFGHGPKGLTRDPASANEESLYRSGKVPLGILENAEPLHDRFTFLVGTAEPSFRHGMFWGLQWWNGHIDSPQAAGAKEAVRRGIGAGRWWE